MPYIKSGERKCYNELIRQLASLVYPEPVGHMNYVITKFIHECLPDQPTYHDLNEMIGVLECAKQELLRTVVGPYEDGKRKLNGPVSDLDGGA